MSAQTFFWIILSITWLDYIVDVLIKYVNMRSLKKRDVNATPLFYDPEKFLVSRKYHNDLNNASFARESVLCVFTSLMLLLSGFGEIDRFVNEVFDNIYLKTLLFLGLVALARIILTLPIQFYHAFFIEKSYGFNRSTVKTFFKDNAIKHLLTGIVSGIVVLIFMSVLLAFPQGSLIPWMISSMAIIFFFLIFNYLYSSLIIPLFNALTPLRDDALCSAIQEHSQKAGFPLNNIFVINSSKRSNRAIAFFSGFGKKKKILLSDTLIKKFTVPEVVAIVFHEAGHFKKNHLLWSYLLSTTRALVILWAFFPFVYRSDLSLALGASHYAIYLNMLAFSILILPVSGIMNVLTRFCYRRFEYEADAYSIEIFKGNAMSSALKKLADDSLENVYVHPLYAFFYSTHPGLFKRLKYIEQA